MQRGPQPVDPLRHHGDADLAPGLRDLAVNVRPGTPPAWLTALLHDADLAAYPDARRATAAVAARHDRPIEEVLLTNGAAEAFVLLAHGLGSRRPLVVHPQFTEPEAALRAAGHEVTRHVLTPPFILDASTIDPDADLVMIGNPTNPTSVLHPAAEIEKLARPGRVLVVDEAFADCVPGERESLAPRRDIEGLIVVRSLTKTWGLAGLRIGYLLGHPDLLAGPAAHQPLWAVSTPALIAAEAISTPAATAEAQDYAVRLTTTRRAFIQTLSGCPGVEVVADARASFLLLHIDGRPDLRHRLADAGWAVRRGDTFPGLGPDWIRVAVRDPDTNDAFAETLRHAVSHPLPAAPADVTP